MVLKQRKSNKKSDLGPNDVDVCGHHPKTSIYSDMLRMHHATFFPHPLHLKPQAIDKSKGTATSTRLEIKGAFADA